MLRLKAINYYSPVRFVVLRSQRQTACALDHFEVNQFVLCYSDQISNRMLQILVIVVTLGVSTCLQFGSPGTAKILSSHNDHPSPSAYRFSFDQSDGIARYEEGAVGVNPNQLRSEANSRDDPRALHVNGAVYWTDKDGANYEMTYKSGTYGYRTIIKRIS